MVVLAPATVNEKTPCAYGLSPARSSSGNLEADARAAILEALPGWSLKSDTPDRRDRGASKYRVRIYDEFVLGRWTRAMSLLDENAQPALEAQYMRIEDSR